MKMQYSRGRCENLTQENQNKLETFERLAREHNHVSDRADEIVNSPGCEENHGSTIYLIYFVFLAEYLFLLSDTQTAMRQNTNRIAHVNYMFLSQSGRRSSFIYSCQLKSIARRTINVTLAERWVIYVTKNLAEIVFLTIFHFITMSD